MPDNGKAPDQPIKLRACDDDDLKVIAALLQDALVELGEMTFLSEDGRFAAVFDRFMWEDAKRLPDLKTVRCGVCFDGVSHVKVSGIDQNDRGQVLELLTILTDAAAASCECAVELVFAGGGIVRIEAKSLECRVEDLGTPRPAPVRPRHPVLPNA